MHRPPDVVAINPAALRHIRRITGLGVSALAEEIGVVPSYVSNLEAGRRTAVSPRVFRALCTALRIEDVRALMADPAGASVTASVSPEAA
jgi:transcriptional regulator with XRE-family HTH domain